MSKMLCWRRQPVSPRIPPPRLPSPSPLPVMSTAWGAPLDVEGHIAAARSSFSSACGEAQLAAQASRARIVKEREVQLRTLGCFFLGVCGVGWGGGAVTARGFHCSAPLSLKPGTCALTRDVHASFCSVSFRPSGAQPVTHTPTAAGACWMRRSERQQHCLILWLARSASTQHWHKSMPWRRLPGKLVPSPPPFTHYNLPMIGSA